MVTISCWLVLMVMIFMFQNTDYMLGKVQSFTCFISSNSQITLKEGLYYFPISQMRKLRLRQVR